LVLRNGLTFRGALVGAEAESVLISYAGSEPIAIEALIAATLVAPNATLRFATGSVSHSGSAFAISLRIKRARKSCSAPCEKAGSSAPKQSKTSCHHKSITAWNDVIVAR
jgi:hypothetical protein